MLDLLELEPELFSGAIERSGGGGFAAAETVAIVVDLSKGRVAGLGVA